jgi:glucose-1-phosphate thymidylyltransferase
MTPRAVVLARGLGTRMRATDPNARLTADQVRAADAGMKAMMPLNGRPFLDYVLSTLADAGIDRIALVVAPDHAAVQDHYTRAAPPRRVHLDYIVQPEPIGTANAIASAERWCGDEPFLALNSDNLYPSSALRALAGLGEPGVAAFSRDELTATGNIGPDRIRAFALLDIDADGYLTRIVEKPQHDPDTPLVSMNLWRFDSRIFGACRDVPRSSRGEYELPGAVSLAMDRGVRFRAVLARGPVLDLSARGDAADVERRLGGWIPSP